MTDIIVPRRREDIFTERGDITLRFARWMEAVTLENNTTTTIINQSQSGLVFSAQLQQIIKQLDGLPEFTMDTTGFTMDSTEWTMDKVLA